MLLSPRALSGVIRILSVIPVIRRRALVCATLIAALPRGPSRAGIRSHLRDADRTGRETVLLERML